MICVCNDCKFLFSRTEMPDNCPDCGSEFVREADESERLEFEKIKKEHGQQ